uniref:Uncharacterized protein n=1 Tax=Arabidopsis thaliana TaxID=3702 RepID=Q56XK9_ARATH|nr:hypothetical protein [Arabidopsis thaliana]
MLVTWQMTEEQLQVTASSNPLAALGFLHPPSDKVSSHGSTLKFQLLFFNAVATLCKASTANFKNCRLDQIITPNQTYTYKDINFCISWYLLLLVMLQRIRNRRRG